MTILVTAASGQLGHLVVESLLARGAEPTSIVAGARTPDKIADLAELGVRTVELDYDRPETLATALEGVDTLLLVSGSEPGKRVPQHLNVVEAAKTAGVTKLVYTSAPRATTAEFVLGTEHKATEEAIVASGIPAVIVRNNWYSENYAADVARAAETGSVASSTGAGRIASASRADFADGAAVVLLEDGHIGEVYEFAGDTTWDYDDFATTLSEIVGRDVERVSLSTDEHIAMLTGVGLDEGMAGFVAGIDTGIRNGVLDVSDDTLSRLIGRPTTPLADTLRTLA